MKTLYIYIITLISSVFLFSCEKEETGAVSENLPGGDIQYTEGEIYHRELKDGDGNRLAYLEEKFVNFGNDKEPILLLVTQKIDNPNGAYNGFFNTARLEKMQLFFGIWAKYIGQEYNTQEEKINVVKNFYNFYTENLFDMALYVNAITSLDRKVSISQINSQITTITKSGDKKVNDILYNILDGKNTLSKTETKGTVKNIVKIFNNVIDTGESVIQFIHDTVPTSNPPEAKVSLLNSSDINLNNYSDGIYKNIDHALSYWLLNHHHTQVTYSLRANYNCTNNNVPGHYAKHAEVVTTYYNITEQYHANGIAYYSNSILNVGTSESPIVQVSGNVEVDYGNRVTNFISRSNFYVNGQSGLYEGSYDDGK